MGKSIEANQLSAHLLKVLNLVRSGTEVVITEHRKPVARMLSIYAPNGRMRLSKRGRKQPESGNTGNGSGQNEPEADVS
jgi:prevent-host-death family protein